ncbi:condensation protein [Streptomyces sp. RK75]|uniref:condensation protein n=1 Tax=Streptomyces sp. RK75 TaxID=2824895 RepID=UPI001B36AED6|nr:condensation protein [Streptomyces sp. RK75]MBQ0863259.1 condensation protein [Streptomyces sp. RK75]
MTPPHKGASTTPAPDSPLGADGSHGAGAHGPHGAGAAPADGAAEEGGGAVSRARRAAGSSDTRDADGMSESAVVSGGAAQQAGPTPVAPGGPAGERRIPFPTVDEITRHCLDDDEPETVHVEIHLPALPDPKRLRAAFAEAMRRHPRILLRQAPTRWWRPRYEWVLTDGPDRDPVSFPGGTLEEARRRALARCPSLDASPPFRAEVIEHGGEGGCVLLVTINHTALDGPACLRVVASAAELYGGADNSPAPPPVRPPGEPRGTQPESAPGSRPWTRPARVAADTCHPGAPGNGMLIAELPVPDRPPRAADEPAAYTVNDQLLVATWLMVARWNSAHEEPVRPVRITMPVDDRPRTADMPIGNGTRLVEVTFGAQEREMHRALTAPGAPDREAIGRLLRTTAARTRALKSVDRPQLGFSGDLLTTPLLPVGLRAAGIRTLRRAAGPWASTTLLSNIGRVPYPLDFGDAGRARAVWFSAPAKVPRGLSVTTVSTGGRLQLALRWSHARLDDSAGERLGALFAESLAATSYTPAESDEGHS